MTRSRFSFLGSLMVFLVSLLDRIDLPLRLRNFTGRLVAMFVTLESIADSCECDKASVSGFLCCCY